MNPVDPHWPGDVLIVVSDAEMAAINIKRAEFHGEWNFPKDVKDSPDRRCASSDRSSTLRLDGAVSPLWVVD